MARHERGARAKKRGCIQSANPSNQHTGILTTHHSRQVIAAHDGPVLCCTICPDGSRIASSGADEHISIRDAVTGEEILTLDDALDGKGLTIKFSFDGSRLQVRCRAAQAYNSWVGWQPSCLMAEQDFRGEAMRNLSECFIQACSQICINPALIMLYDPNHLIQPDSRYTDLNQILDSCSTQRCIFSM